MAGITLEQAQLQLQSWLDASAAVARKQSYSISGRSLTLADAATIQRNIEYWDGKVKTLTASASGGRRIRFGVSE